MFCALMLASENCVLDVLCKKSIQVETWQVKKDHNGSCHYSGLLALSINLELGGINRRKLGHKSEKNMESSNSLYGMPTMLLPLPLLPASGSCRGR